MTPSSLALNKNIRQYIQCLMKSMTHVFPLFSLPNFFLYHLFSSSFCLVYFCVFLYLSLKDIFVDICKALLCNGIKHPIIEKKIPFTLFATTRRRSEFSFSC